jgi:hypothetical protein
MKYPVKMTFKIFAMAPQIYIRDASDDEICFVQQKLFRLKEHVVVHSDSAKSSTLCEIKADRMIDWSASYHFYDRSGVPFGSVRRRGMRSIFAAHYDILDEHDKPLGTIKEENPSAKFFDAALGEIPVLGMLSGYLFHPKYILKGIDDQPKMRITKQPALLEGKFSIDKLSEFDEVDELTFLMSFMMMILLERRRG